MSLPVLLLCEFKDKFFKTPAVLNRSHLLMKNQLVPYKNFFQQYFSRLFTVSYFPVRWRLNALGYRQPSWMSVKTV